MWLITRSLIRTEALAVPWQALLWAFLFGGVFAILASIGAPSFENRELPIRFALSTLASGLVFAFGDEAAEIKAAVPTPLRVRVGVRILTTGVFWLIATVVTLTVAAIGTTSDNWSLASNDSLQLPKGRFLVEGFALAGVAAIIGAVISRVRWEKFAPPGAAGFVTLFLLSRLLPAGITPWQAQGADRWGAITMILVIVAITGWLGALAVGWDARRGS